MGSCDLQDKPENDVNSPHLTIAMPLTRQEGVSLTLLTPARGAQWARSIFELEKSSFF